MQTYINKQATLAARFGPESMPNPCCLLVRIQPQNCSIKKKNLLFKYSNSFLKKQYMFPLTSHKGRPGFEYDTQLSNHCGISFCSSYFGFSITDLRARTRIWIHWFCCIRIRLDYFLHCMSLNLCSMLRIRDACLLTPGSGDLGSGIEKIQIQYPGSYFWEPYEFFGL